jgi:uncharacterized damage-inducible protein DinB
MLVYKGIEMSEGKHLSDALTGLISNPENGWFTPVIEAIKGLTGEQASKIPMEGFNSIWAIIDHMSYWQMFTLHRLRGESVEHLEDDPSRNWSNVYRPFDDREWQASCERLVSSNKELAETVYQYTDDEMDMPYMEGRPKRYQVIQGIIAHNCYHTNEVITTRHMLGLWLERT